MNNFRLWLLTALLPVFLTDTAQAQWPAARSRSFFQSQLDMDVVFRAQSEDGGVPVPNDADGTTPSPSAGTNTSPDNGFSTFGTPSTESTFGPALPDASTWNAFSPQITPDPFVTPMVPQGGAPSPYAPYSAGPYGGAPGGYRQFGANAAQPYRFGWRSSLDISWLPETGVASPPGGASGDFGVFGLDYEAAYTGPFIPGWILTWTNQFGLRQWDGPGGTVSLPGNAYRFGIDWELETPQQGPFSISLGFNPSINTDFDTSPGSRAWQLDGRGILFMQLDQFWTLGLGAAYWDRVEDRVIPYAGLIYRDDYWEWQLMFPESRVALFLGNEAYWSKWFYVRGEYHVESYEVGRRFGGVTSTDEVELADWRILMGFDMDTGMSSWFIEGGWVFGRDVEYLNAAVPGFEPETGFMAQMGFRY